MAKKTSNLIICRVLVATVIAEATFEPNTLVKGDEALLKPLIESDHLSDCKVGIEYCQKELKVEVTDLTKFDNPSENE